MRHNFRHSLVALTVAATLAGPGAVYATNGYFLHGYGVKSSGMGGVGVAFPQDATAAAINPAGMAMLGNRVDLGVAFFSPQRKGELDATRLGGADSGEIDSGATLYAIPSLGLVSNLGRFSFGVTAYANGGLNTRYNHVNIYDAALAPAAGVPVGAIPNTGTLGVNLVQVIIAPTLAAGFLNNTQYVGASLLIGHQRFRAYGLGDFAAFGFSNDPTSLTNRGDDRAWGAGVRVGWIGKITDWLNVGAAYSTKVYMQEFDKYKGLFAEQGDFDIPANWSVGLALKPSSRLTVAFDVLRIEYGGVAAISNPGPTTAEFTAPFLGQPVNRPAGTDNGFGFGWNDQWVYKLGINYDYSDRWTLRGGVNYGESPIDSDQNLFNILAPGVVEWHLTLGLTYHPSPNNEFNLAYMHALDNRQTYFYDTSAILGPGTGYEADISMYQNSLEASYSWKF